MMEHPEVKQHSEGELEILAEVADVQFDAVIGGLIVLGPAPGPLPGLEALIESPGAVPMKVDAVRLENGDTARAEVVLLSRRVSSVIRRGETPIVYLDSHVDGGVIIPADRYDFVSQRLGQMIVGLADMPSYLGLRGTAIAPLMLLQGLGSFAQAATGVMIADMPLMRVSTGPFRDIHVAIGEATGPITQFVQFFDWCEARRSSEGECHDPPRQ